MTFNPNDVPSHKGWSKHRAAALANLAAREEARTNPEALRITAERRAVYKVQDAEGALMKAIEKRAELESALQRTKASLRRLEEREFATGEISEAGRNLAAQIGGLPRLIERAEEKIAVAQKAVAEAKAELADLRAKTTAGADAKSSG